MGYETIFYKRNIDNFIFNAIGFHFSISEQYYKLQSSGHIHQNKHDFNKLTVIVNGFIDRSD